MGAGFREETLKPNEGHQGPEARPSTSPSDKVEIVSPELPRYLFFPLGLVSFYVVSLLEMSSSWFPFFFFFRFYRSWNNSVAKPLFSLKKTRRIDYCLGNC